MQISQSAMQNAKTVKRNQTLAKGSYHLPAFFIFDGGRFFLVVNQIATGICLINYNVRIGI